MVVVCRNVERGGMGRQLIIDGKLAKVFFIIYQMQIVRKMVCLVYVLWQSGRPGNYWTNVYKQKNKNPRTIITRHTVTAAEHDEVAMCDLFVVHLINFEFYIS